MCCCNILDDFQAKLTNLLDPKKNQQKTNLIAGDIYPFCSFSQPCLGSARKFGNVFARNAKQLDNVVSYLNMESNIIYNNMQDIYKNFHLRLHCNASSNREEFINTIWPAFICDELQYLKKSFIQTECGGIKIVDYEWPQILPFFPCKFKLQFKLENYLEQQSFFTITVFDKLKIQKKIQKYEVSVYMSATDRSLQQVRSTNIKSIFAGSFSLSAISKSLNKI